MASNDREEDELVRRLCSGDATAFETLVSRHHQAMLQLARTFVSTDSDAEEVVQDAWLGALRGIERFQGRSTVRTWLFRILVNRAKTRGVREARSIPYSAVCLGECHRTGPERSADGDHRCQTEALQQAGSRRRRDAPDLALLDCETRDQIGRALDHVPEAQRRVVVLRDVYGLSGDEVCALLELSEANQRVLLHRGRTRLRSLLADLQPA